MQAEAAILAPFRPLLGLEPQCLAWFLNVFDRFLMFFTQKRRVSQVSELQKKLEETRRESEIQALKVSRDHGDAVSKFFGLKDVEYVEFYYVLLGFT